MLKGAVLYILTLTSASGYYTTSPCPQQCICTPNFTDCKSNNFSNLPTGLDPNVTVLDLSYNNFQVFPMGLNDYSNLRYLNLSHNKIQNLSGTWKLVNLERLDLAYNAFSDRLDLKSVFNSAKKLAYLDLSHNRLQTLPFTRNPSQVSSLTTLRLVNCSIEYMNNNILETLPNLIELYLANNPIKYLTAELSSNSLKFLDLSRCGLQQVGRTVFRNLTSLEMIYMSGNTNLKKFHSDSPSLTYLYLPDCNLEDIPSGNLPKLHEANFHGNHFGKISKYGFLNYSNLEVLDLSNALSSVEENAFTGLDKIRRIDLSQNALTNMASDAFTSNKNLKYLNLSRNYFSTLQNFDSVSLTNLDLSSCEIQSVDFDSLIDMPNLEVLDLSKNIISLLPDNWQAENLVSLDVSLCRIKTLNNRTFASMSSLRFINLAGNRLTFVSPEVFMQVLDLDISDNPWRCDCHSLQPLYNWLSKTGKRTDGLNCQSPDIYEGVTWTDACSKDWHPDKTNTEASIWWYTTGLIVTVFAILFVILVMRRMYLLKEKRIREADAARRVEERETLRRMQRMQAEAREEASRNAPDPRELQRPPSYHEALLLPRLDASHPSLSGSLHSLASKHSISGSNPDVSKRGRPRRKRRRRKSDSSEGQRASRVVVDSDTSDPERPQPRTTLESDF